MSSHFNPGDVVEVAYPFAEGEDAKGRSEEHTSELQSH